MASREQDERRLTEVVSGALRRWLSRTRRAVMAPWRAWGLQPEPAAVFGQQAAWDGEVDTIVTELGRVAMSAWVEATDVPPVSRHAFVVAQLAQTQNLLARIPDEVYQMIFAAITDATNAGADTAGVADAVERVLNFNGSENWPHRARVIATTETTRARGAGTVAAGMEMARITGRALRKRWRTESDERVRASHRAVNGATVAVFMPFQVGGWPLQFPGDPLGPADEVVGCRCDLVIVDEVQ